LLADLLFLDTAAFASSWSTRPVACVSSRRSLARPVCSIRSRCSAIGAGRNWIPVVEFERFRDAYLDELASAIANDF